MCNWGTRLGAIAAVVVGMIAGTASASLLAQDSAAEAAYGDGWQPGDNGGSGWGGGWTFKSSSNATITTGDSNRGFFFFDSRDNNNPAGAGGDSNGDGDINSANDRAWGLYANSASEIYAVRPFSGALSVGQTVAFDFDNGNITSGGVVGVRLVSDANNPATSREFEIRFVGGDSFYNHTNGGGFSTSTMGFSREGIHVEFTLTGANTYSLFAERLQDGSTYSTTGTTQSGNPINGLALRNQNAGSGAASNGYFNSIAIPEPSSLGMLFVAGAALARRRRA
jgi:hypothetical protein